jgi:hypothetical protein
MTTKQVNAIVDSMLHRIPRVRAAADDPRIRAGELLTEERARAMLTADVRRILADSQRELNEWVTRAFAKAIRGVGKTTNVDQQKRGCPRTSDSLQSKTLAGSG